MKNWLVLQRIRLYLKIDHAVLVLVGSADYANFEFGLSDVTLWQTGVNSYLGGDGLLSWGEHARFLFGEDGKAGNRWSVKMYESGLAPSSNRSLLAVDHQWLEVF